MSAETPNNDEQHSAGERRSGKLVVICVVAIAALTAMDLGSKKWAIDALSSERHGGAPAVCEPNARGHIPTQRLQTRPTVLVEDYLELRYAENCGAAFGLMRDAPLGARQAVFGIAAVIASLALMWMFVKARGGVLFAFSVPFIVAGAVGNFVDRVRYGYVVDFILFLWKGDPAWPTFNLADTWITIGVVLLLIDGLREGRREKLAERERRQASGSKAEASGGKAETEKG